MKLKIFLVGVLLSIMIFASVVEASARFKVNIQNGSTDDDLSSETISGIENNQGTEGWKKYWVTNQTVSSLGTTFTWNTTNTGPCNTTDNTMDVSEGTFSWSTLDNATTLSLTDDEVTGLISMGFNTEFYGTIYNAVAISSNGFVTFNVTDPGCCTGQNLPDTGAPNGVIVGWWEDLRPTSAGGSGTIKYQSITEGGTKWFVIEYNNVTHYPNNNPVTFQIAIGEKW